MILQECIRRAIALSPASSFAAAAALAAVSELARFKVLRPCFYLIGKAAKALSGKLSCTQICLVVRWTLFDFSVFAVHNVINRTACSIGVITITSFEPCIIL